MDQHDDTSSNAKVLLLAIGGATLVALLIALGRRHDGATPRDQVEEAVKDIEKEAKKAAKAANKEAKMAAKAANKIKKKIEEDLGASGHRLATDLRESAATIAAKAEAAERDLKAAAWDAHQEAKEAESRLGAARQRVVDDASHLASRVGAEARHLAGGGRERLAHLRHRDDGDSPAEREAARLRAELEELKAELARTGRRAEKDVKRRFPRVGDKSAMMQAVASDASAAALAQVERALRAKAPALLTARSRAQVMEILQQDLGPTLRETAMHAAAAAMSSWDAARDHGESTRGRAQHAAETIRGEASHAESAFAKHAEHVRDDVVEAAEEAARIARKRAEAAAHEVESVREAGKRRFWRAADDAQQTVDNANNGVEEAAEPVQESASDPASEEHRSKAGLFWGGAGLGLALYALLDAERREKVILLANEASVQIQELVRDLQGYDDEF